MRLTTLLVVATVAFAGLAGCFGKTDSTTDPGTGGNTTATATATASPTATPTTGGSGTNGTTPGALAPKEIKKVTHDFTSDAPVAPPAGGLPVSSAAPDKFTVDAGYSKITINVSWANAQGLPQAPNNGATVKVGSYTCQADNPAAGPKTCPVGSASATPGPGQIEYSGDGPVIATISIIES